MTKLLYLTDAYLQEATAKVIDVSPHDKNVGIILNQTIFYPQGGGQPSDKGRIEGKNGSAVVTHVTYNHGQPLHVAKMTGELKKGDSVKLVIDWPQRFQNMRLHSAGHVLHEAVKKAASEAEPIEGMHGIGGTLYIKYRGIIDRTLVPHIQQELDEIIASDAKITTTFVTLEELKREASWIPPNLPEDKPLRIATIEGFDPIPDGGTQVASTREIGTVQVLDIDYEEGNSIVRYAVDRTIERKTKRSQTVLIAPDSFNQELTKIETEALKELRELKPKQVEKLRITYLGKKGAINHLSKLIASLPPSEKASAGRALNVLKQKIQESLSSITTASSLRGGWLDVTIPGKLPALGHLHPITQAIEEISRIFERIGFTRVRYPEVDWDWYVFESLNMPRNHPARDEWETFFIDTPAHSQKGDMVLTTHTSNGQVREMERVKQPPIRMLNIAKCYRRQQDVTHTSMFHQFEGLVVDAGITIQHLKGVLDYFARTFYGSGAKSRIRPSMFRFTEPSFEVDFSCVHCNGTGKLSSGERCRFCKSGWHEVGGAGMVHPTVLRNGGINPATHTGFAFGWGVERVYTLKPGLELDDIRPLYSTNLEFLEQF